MLDRLRNHVAGFLIETGLHLLTPEARMQAPKIVRSWLKGQGYVVCDG